MEADVGLSIEDFEYIYNFSYKQIEILFENFKKTKCFACLEKRAQKNVEINNNLEYYN